MIKILITIAIGLIIAIIMYPSGLSSYIYGHPRNWGKPLPENRKKSKNTINIFTIFFVIIWILIIFSMSKYF